MARFDPFTSDFEHLFVNSSPDYGPRHGPGRLRPIGDMSPSPAADNASFQERRNRLRDLGDSKNQLIDDLLSQLETAQKELAQLQTLTFDGIKAQTKAKRLEEQLKQIESLVDRDPCITILLDGNHITFTKSLIQKGELGGKDAAERLHKALEDFATQRLPDVETPRFILRMYSDFKSLTSYLTKSNVIGEAATFDDFMRGFNSTKHQFDLIDSGTNQEYTEQKLTDLLQSSLHNCHCRHVLIGGFEGDKYSEALQKFRKTPEVMMRLSLLENAPPRQNIPEWKRDFSTVKVDEVLCDIASAAAFTGSRPATTAAIAAPVLARIESSSTASLRTPPASASSTPQMTWAGLAAQPVVASAIPSLTKPTTTVSHSKFPPSVPKKAPNHGVIEYNRFGQRIDKQDSTIPYHEITRIKKMKLCNTYYLQESASCTSGCSHRHDYPITNFERKVLREVARMTPCHYKMECDDVDCIYGHRCPQSKPNEDGCYFGEDCRFWGWGHGIDTRVVKTTKI